MTNPYDPPPAKTKAKQHWLTMRFVLEFVIGGVIGFFILCFMAIMFLFSMAV